MFVSSHHAAARGDVLFDAADLRMKRQSWNLTQSPPKNYLSTPYWIQTTWDTSLNLSAGGAVVENAQGFVLSAFPDASAIASLFDQYCIYSVHVRAILDLTASTVVVGARYGQIYSALDFDSSGAVSSVGAIERYSSLQVAELVPDKSYERFVKPACMLVTGSSNSTSSTGVALGRFWLNSATQNVPHFGIRFLTAGNGSVTSPLVRFYITAIIGVRNTI